jgi:hypothetical protein
MKPHSRRRPAGAAALRARLDALTVAAAPVLLPVGQPEFSLCSNAIARFANTNSGRMLPLPSSVLPPPL